MMQLIFESGLFGLTLTFGVYILTTRLNERTRCPVLNPVLMAILVIIGVLLVFDIPLQDYLDGANIITLMLTPTTALLAYSIYNQLPLLKKYFIPIVAGCLAGSAASMVSVYVLCQVMGLGETLTATMLPKSVTTPIAMEISSQLGGISSVTVAAVVLTGIFGNILAPYLIKLFRIKNRIAAGVGIGCSSHAGGTSKAMEIGDVEGAMSGVSIGIAGILTVVLAMLVR